MPFVAQDPTTDRVSLLVCDGCNGVLAHDGTTTAKAHRESMPEDLAPHFDSRSTLRGIARASGWSTGADTSGDGSDAGWTCGRCSTASPPIA